MLFLQRKEENMKKYIPILKKTQMFAGVGEEEIAAMLSCLGARCGFCKKGEYVLRQGERLKDIVVLAEGKLHIQKEDYWGNRSILGQIGPGELFGEAYAAPESGTLLNDVIAVEESSVFFFGIVNSFLTLSPHQRYVFNFGQ